MSQNKQGIQLIQVENMLLYLKEIKTFTQILISSIISVKNLAHPSVHEEKGFILMYICHKQFKSKLQNIFASFSGLLQKEKKKGIIDAFKQCASCFVM